MNLATALRERNAAHPERLAITSEGGASLTYGEFFDSVARAAGRLAASGVSRGARVVMFAENCAAYPIVYLACARLGAAMATAHPDFRRNELAEIIAQCHPAAVVVDAPLLETFNDAMSAHRRPVAVITIDSRNEAADLWGTERVDEDADVSDDHPVLIAYTSGSTSRPKAVVHCHAGQVFVVTTHQQVWHLSSDDRLLQTLSMSWLYGLTTSCLASLFAGAHVMMLRHFNPVRALGLIEREGATVMTGVTTMYLKLLDASHGRSVRSLLRLCVAGGEPRNEVAFERFAERFGVPVLDAYASSECLPIIAHDNEALSTIHDGAVGRPVPAVETRIIDANGAAVPAGEIGELIVRSPGQMIGYLDPEMTAAVLQSGWYHTRDLWRQDEDGCLFILGRMTEMIIRGGANISPIEVERVLATYPGVNDCAVIGATDETYGQAPYAFIVVAAGSGVNEDQLRAFCSARLASFKVPARFTFVDQLPHGPNGKIARNQLDSMLPL